MQFLTLLVAAAALCTTIAVAYSIIAAGQSPSQLLSPFKYAPRDTATIDTFVIEIGLDVRL